MSLLYLPYVPSLHEDMILRGRRILVDQSWFKASWPGRVWRRTLR